MKVETIVSEKKFEPITFNVTVESLGELCLLWGRLNPNSSKIAEYNKLYTDIVKQFEHEDADTYYFFTEVDQMVRKFDLR